MRDLDRFIHQLDELENAPANKHAPIKTPDRVDKFKNGERKTTAEVEMTPKKKRVKKGGGNR